MNLKSNLKKRKGISLVWVVLTFLAMFAIGGLMLDWAHVFLVGHQLQNAADSSALAGARYVAWDPNTTTKIVARNEALTYAQANDAAHIPVNVLLNTSNAPEGDVVIGRYADQNRTFTPTLNNPNAMKVVAQKDGISNARMPLLFGRLFGFAERDNIRKYAIAKIYNASGAAVIALSDDDLGLYLHGNPEINIENGGSIYANTVDTSADFRGNPATDVAEINLVGGYDISGNNFNPNELTYDGLPATLNSNVDPIVDPYADLPEPDYAGLPDLGTIEEAGTIDSPKVYNPGYYSGGIEKPDSGYVTLNPGVYILDGTSNKGGLNIPNDQCTIVAEGVMLYIVGGSVNINGGDLTLSPPTSGTYEGVSIFQKRGYDEPAEINGNGELDMTGVLYFPDNNLWVAGNGDTIGTQLIADTIEIAGTGEINIPWNGTPEVALKSYLVE